MKILYCGVDQYLGGIEAFVLNTYGEIHSDEIQIDFLKITDKIYFEEVFIEKNSKIHKITSRRKNPLKFVFELYRLLKNENYDVIHHHLNSCSSIEPIILGRLLGIKTIAHSHNEFKGNKRLTNIMHYLNSKILTFFSNENLACSKIAGISMFGNEKFELIKNGIDSSKYIFNDIVRKSYRSKMDLENNYVIGHIGNFKYQKNHDFLIDIFNDVNKKNKNSKLLLIGDGELKKDVIDKVKNYGLGDNVVFTGVREDVSNLLQAIDIFVFPSRYEGLGIVVIEAQAAGLKSIVSENIPKEAFISDLVESISLSTEKKIWVEKVLKHSNNYQRKDMSQEIQKNGYDKRNSSKRLREIYLNIHN
ncbi:glycosyl transferase group 1 [Exiguobacterium sibiricum 255-15]|uniref:Glycosyl transferase group 1 n=1 Tax=Exiguobacterium sibiricum (strain DSM 17290 / CCUG 55495 / CIP 109462 / JCM 13490 / 255-15) TaxID=262543 RepID=B1YML6_EXIS2|nr:glycosyltransferase [Exiguobacterium sibiricum]ACB62076.1 glycosyl transferase group 1 [Exiguobacterium sibiricum 255-15]